MTQFINVLDAEDKECALQLAISGAASGLNPTSVVVLEVSTLKRLPGTAFAYWVSPEQLEAFDHIPQLESRGLVARVTNPAGDDFRYFRAAWEVAPRNIGRYARWVPLAKGGAFSPFYADIHLLVDWDESRRSYRDFYGTVHRPLSKPASLEYFFRPGITWPRRTDGLSFRILPAGCIFADKGPAIFEVHDDPRHLLRTLALVNSAPFKDLVKTLLARTSLAQSFEVGLVRSIPLPEAGAAGDQLERLALNCIAAARESDRGEEVSHLFITPNTFRHKAPKLSERMRAVREAGALNRLQLEAGLSAINQLACALYGLDNHHPSPREASEPRQSRPDAQAGGPSVKDGFKEEATAFASFIVGCLFGRWDIRFATGEKLIPELPDPFDPLPAYSPGMLKRGDLEDGNSYPIAIAESGILVDDPDNPDDVVRRVQSVLAVLFPSADEIEIEACQLLGVKSLREYFRNPTQFFDSHIKMYSKSRRKAPIYWLLQSTNRSYGLWLYYHKLDADTLFKALHTYVVPKVQLEENRLVELRGQAEAALGAKEKALIEKAIEGQEANLDDIVDFRDKLRRAADLHVVPDLDDGVVLTMAPLHKLVSWKEPTAYWKELIAGKHEWSSIGKQLGQKGLVTA
jgi:hypothetical protein